jgi:hypothetical protein
VIIFLSIFFIKKRLWTEQWNNSNSKNISCWAL